MNYERFELSNGLRVIAAPMPAMRSATAAVFVGSGSRAESDKEAGVAHLIEHMLFKGTIRRPNSQAISETLERVGGMINASTDKEATVYWTKVASEHLELAIDLLSDMLQHSRLARKEIEKERTVIVEELGMSMDDPQDWVHGLIDELMWPGHPLGRDVGGTKESVRGLTRKQVRQFLTSHYGSTNALLVVAGGLKVDEVRVLAESYFGGWTPVEPDPLQPAPDFGPQRTRIEIRGTEQVHMCVGFPGVSRYDPDRYSLDLLTTILGGSTTSRLFLEVRERLALAYDIHVYSNKLADTGSVVIYAGVEPARAGEATEAILHEIDRLRRRIVPSHELEKTLSYVKGRLYLGLEDTHAVASWLGSQELMMDCIESPEEVIAAIEAVSPRAIRDVANRLFDRSQARVACIGPDAPGITAALAA
jgi:predicted Zn-dependent peptidase